MDDRALHRGRPPVADRQRAETLYGAEGKQVVDDVDEFVAGINAYIAEALLDPTKLPAEYAAFGKTPQPWKADRRDRRGVADRRHLRQGRRRRGALGADAPGVRSGGSARPPGARRGRASASKNDPEAPTTVSKRFPYETGSPFATSGLAMPDPGSVSFPGRLRRAPAARAAAGDGHPGPVAIPDDGSIGAQLLRDAARRPAARVQLGAGQRQALDQRPRDRA